MFSAHRNEGRRLSVTAVGLLLLGAVACGSPAVTAPRTPDLSAAAFEEAAANGRLAHEGFLRSLNTVRAWLEYADPVTGLIPRNLQESRDVWNPQDAAADNYPFMVLTAALTDPALFQGRMQDMLRSEEKHTSRLGRLPDTYSFSRQDFLVDEPVLDDIIFGASEYVKDGLLPVTEWLGASPWSERMLDILDELWARAPVETPYGNIVSTNQEINGEMLQTLSRVYWMTGEAKYLDYALRLGDYYLLGSHHPTRNSDRIRLRDHGCEIVSGLTELYAAVHFARPEKKQDYQEPIHAMLDRILEVGRNVDGLFYNEVNPRTGEPIQDGIADTFGYTFNGYYIVYRLDAIERYRDAVVQGLESLNENYRSYNWENLGVDGYADAIEGALNIYNREPLESVREWMDREIHVMWGMQDDHPGPRGISWEDSAIIEGMHPDGNFMRTSLLYALWKTRGISVRPWREDMTYGAVQRNDSLLIHVTVEQSWNGELVFDRPRHRTDMKLPYDWPRINQFPEWFAADPDARYALVDVEAGTKEVHSGKTMQQGLRMRLEPGAHRFLVMEEGGE